jgi:hypothetical protein
MLLECLLFALVLTLLIIIISMVVGADFDLRETMTKIRRTVGTYNTADEHSIPGLITSMPIMDYRHVWTDGIRVYSCDECPSKSMCPNCPKYKMSSIESFSGGESADPAAGKNLGVSTDSGVSTDGGVSADSTDSTDSSEGSTDSGVSTDIYNDAMISLDAPVRLAHSIQHEFRPDELNILGMSMVNSLGPAYDLDPEFVSSRARIGAGCGTPCNRTKVSVRGLSYDTASLGTQNDDLFDGDRKVVCSHKGAGASSLKLLYTNVMGLENNPPFTASCEFLGPQGYLYKETCALGTVYPI